MYLIQTVQTSWRPQLPLPKELQLTDERHSADDNTKTTSNTTTANHNETEEMERLRGHHHHHQQQQQQQSSLSGSSQQLSNKQKWSFGRLFNKKKKDAECSASSSEEDRKAGFVPAQRQSSTKPKSNKHAAKSTSSRGSSTKALGFDHIVAPQATHMDNEFFLPVEMVPPEPYYQNQSAFYPPSRSSNSLDRRLYLAQQQPSPAAVYAQPQKSRSAQRGKAPPVAGQPRGHSSEEELISLNSSTFSKYRSDESIHSGGQALLAGAAGQSRRSRAARNERYYKRLSRDGEVSHGGVPAQLQPQLQQHVPVATQRYKTQPLPLSIYQAPSANVAPRAAPNSNTSAYVQWQPQARPLQNAMQSDGNKRSISYDSHIHMQNVAGRMQSKPLPPPPPPRDPLRRVHVGAGRMGASSGDLRPVSYAFDQSGRCVSDDRIWQPPHYQSVHSLNSQPGSSIASAPQTQTQHSQHHRRFITRSERNALPGKKSLPNGIDFHYVADATPRSRRPIHMLEASAALQDEPASSGVLRTSKSGLPTSSEQPQQPLAKPRSISSSRLSELRSYPMPMYSEVQKPKRAAAPPPPAQEPDNVICGSLHIKPGEHGSHGQNYVEIRHRDVHKTNSMPHHYQRRSGEDLPNKYEEYVAEKREQHQQAPVPIFTERKASAPAIAPIYFPRKKPANLEEAINELEAIYKSLGLTEPPEPKVEPKPRVPTPSEFEKFALAHADDYDDEDSPAGEPDPVRDDVAYRNLQLANLQHRASEKQPPFGIPVGPIVPAPQSDYLHVEPVVRAPKPKSGSPDIVKDDLAVRALRKDPPGPKSSFMYPMQKKQRATRTQSANIYNLIQRDAAKPSGGDLSSYMELTRSIERAGSMSNLGGGDAGAAGSSDASDVPATLDLLRKLKAQDAELNKRPHIPFRHPNQGGAIAQLPERLNHGVEELPKQAPVPAPRKSLTPEPLLEDALNKIALDAQASSIKLTQELHELRKEALITAARPKLNAEQQKLEHELQQIEAVSEAAKRCGQLLLDTLPDNDEVDKKSEQQKQQPNPRKLHKEGKLIRAIDEVSEAANAVCEKILKDIVTTEPPVVVHEALQVKQPAAEQQLVMPHLIKKLDPIQSDKIEAIAKRCMRQLSELAESTPDYDNLAGCNMSTAGAGAASAGQQVHADATLICPIAEVAKTKTTTNPKTKAQAKSQTLEDIDKIMQECERQARQGGRSSMTVISNTTTTSSTNASSTDDQRTTAPSMSSGSGSSSHHPNAVSTTASSFSSSSDCLAKSSSPSTASRPMSSSITSFNPYSSSDYIKSQSSDYHAPSTDPIKTFSTTSYDVQSTPSHTTISTNTQSTLSTTSNNTTSNTTNTTSDVQTASATSPSSSPPLQLTPVGESGGACSSSSPSQYNSSEELAAIFGIEEQPKQLRRKQTLNTTTGKGAAAAAPANASTDAATNPRCAPATLVPAIATNPVMNVELESESEPELELDVTTTITANTNTTTTTSSSSSSCSHQSLSTNDSASSASNCSSHSCKLATIPELEQELESELDQERETETETESETRLKLSPNFNRIYASKINIVMDTRATATATVSVPALTQFDSLSSLEETSSNPDSGNASLADYPLAGHANASIELHSACNSRFEVKEHYISEVSFSSTDSTADEETDTECSNRVLQPLSAAGEHDFPRLPTEEELIESLREEAELNETVQQLLTDVKLNETQIELELDETELDDSDLIDIALEEAWLEETKHDELDENTLVDTELDESRPNEIAVAETAQHDESKLDTSELNELDECDSVGLVARRKSVVYETPQINLSICELKLKVEQEAQPATPDNDDDEDEANQSNKKEEAEAEEEASNVDMPISDTLACNEQPRSSSSSSGGGAANEANEIETRCRQGLPALTAADDQPSTSSSSRKALSVFGEVRALQAPASLAGGAAGGGGVTRGGLTTLEHVLVACTVGLITPNDLLTLCLIVIGVIIIVAIALA